MFSGTSKKKVVVFASLALAVIVSLWHDVEVTKEMFQGLKSRNLSKNLGGGACEWVGAIQYYDNGFPHDTKFKKTIIAGYPSGDKRLTYLQLEGLTGLSARDEWEFKFIAHTNQPFIKANYPHHEGIWGWGDVGDQVILVVSEIRKVMVEYHNILWDIGYAQTFEEAYERIQDLYAGVDETTRENAPVEDFLVWRDLRVLDEVHWYSWFIDYYMEGGLMRDMFNHELTKQTQWTMAILPNFFTKHEMRHGRFVDDGENVTESYDPMCATLSEGCYPVLIIDPAKLVMREHGPAEAKKMAKLIQGSEGFDDWMIEEEAWECVWRELIENGKGTKTFRDRIGLDYEGYTFSYEMLSEMYNQLTRVIEKYKDKDDQVAIDLVNILKGHRDGLGLEEPVAESIDYEQLMSYHLAFTPFFPNQKMFVSDDDFYVRTHKKYVNPDMDNVMSIIDRRRAWFEIEMERKRERKIDIKYYDATGWTSLPGVGLASLTPYALDTTYKIDYKFRYGEFAGSGRTDNVAALLSGFIYIDGVIKKVCLTSDDGSKLYFDNIFLKINNDGLHSGATRVCTDVSEGVFKLDIEYFKASGGSALILEWGESMARMKVVPPRAWASAEGRRKYRQLMILNDHLEEDLKTLKETDIMGPTTRAEFNRRKRAAEGPYISEERKLGKKAKNQSIDDILQKPKLEQLKIMRSMFGS